MSCICGLVRKKAPPSAIPEQRRKSSGKASSKGSKHMKASDTLFASRSRTFSDYPESLSQSKSSGEASTGRNTPKDSVEIVESTEGDIASDKNAYAPSAKVKALNQNAVIRRATQDDDFESIRVIVLGICNSGKSTFVKQLKSSFGQGFSEQEYELYHHLILDNALQVVKSILNAMIKLKIPFEDPSNEETRDIFFSIYDSNSIFETFEDVREIGDDEENPLMSRFRKLKKDPGFVEALSRGHEYNLIQTALYLLESFERIFHIDYHPTEEDILMSRSSSQVISSEVIHREGQLPIKVQDFGGYRFQRLKWYSYFTKTIDATVFVHALPCYDYFVEEEAALSQFDESLRTFAEFANETVISQMPLILILNKKDSFIEKMKSSPITQYFPDYKGANDDHAAAIGFIKAKFLAAIGTTNDRLISVYIANILEARTSAALWKVVVKQAKQCHEEKKMGTS